MMVTTSQINSNLAYDILMIDNKELTRDTVQRILVQEGYTVDTAKHGKEAIEKLRTNKFGYRLVITEILMPYTGGFEVIKTIKAESRVPVMVLSAVADGDTINEAFRLSADDFLKKPFMATELVQRIQRLLIRHAAPILTSGIGPSTESGRDSMAEDDDESNQSTTDDGGIEPIFPIDRNSGSTGNRVEVVEESGVSRPGGEIRSISQSQNTNRTQRGNLMSRTGIPLIKKIQSNLIGWKSFATGFSIGRS